MPWCGPAMKEKGEKGMEECKYCGSLNLRKEGLKGGMLRYRCIKATTQC
jgi:hypothetical protein